MKSVNLPVNFTDIHTAIQKLPQILYHAGAVGSCRPAVAVCGGGEGASEHSAGQRLARPIRPWGRRRDQIRCPEGRCDLRGRRRRRLWLRWACVPGAARLRPLCVCALCFVGLSRLFDLCARAEILVKVRPCMF